MKVRLVLGLTLDCPVFLVFVEYVRCEGVFTEAQRVVSMRPASAERWDVVVVAKVA